MGNTKEDIERFLQDYKAICEKYNVHISGCGCCGSPYLNCKSEEMWDEGEFEEDLQESMDSLLDSI